MKKKGQEYLFYPVVGNHDLYNTTAVKKFSTDNPPDTQTRAIIEYNKNNLKNIVNWGPKFDSKLPGYEDNGSQYTNYSFDYKNCHFVIIDLYYANSLPGRGNGNFHKVTAKWLEDDLKKNKGKKTFIFAHEPATPYNFPDDSGTSEFRFHANPDNFLSIIEKNKLKACFSGHTHKYGSIKKNGATHINTGKSGIPKNNTYSMIFVDGDKITYKSYVYQEKKWKEYSDTI
jgi:predicted phosphodiesterase